MRREPGSGSRVTSQCGVDLQVVGQFECGGPCSTPCTYNFVRLHQTLKVTPAMAAGVTDRLWEMKDLVEMIEAFEASQKRAA